MLPHFIARTLLTIVPEKWVATITLLPESPSPTTITINNAWFKPMDVQLSSYGSLALQGDETKIKIPNHELNPAANGRQIRPNDRITISGVAYNVLTTRLMTVRTVWECICRKEMI